MLNVIGNRPAARHGKPGESSFKLGIHSGIKLYHFMEAIHLCIARGTFRQPLFPSAPNTPVRVNIDTSAYCCKLLEAYRQQLLQTSQLP